MRIKNSFVVGVAAAALLFAGTAVAAGGPIQVARSIPFAESSSANQKVKDECHLQTKVTQFLNEYSGRVSLVDEPGKSAQRLELTITDVRASGGGAWSGPKSMTVSGQLFEGGKPGPTFNATRYSGGGMFAGYKGTCSIVGRCAKAIGKDIAKWLDHPTNGASLGDH